MEVVVTSAQMRWCDKYAIQTLKIPSLSLMENAGRGIVDVIEKIFGNLTEQKFLIICGKGNNGGDGFVAARHLFVLGASVTTVLIGKSNELSGDAKINFTTLAEFGKRYKKSERIELFQNPSLKELSMLPKNNFIIDAIFGTGFKGEVKEPYLSIIRWINKRDEIKISLDIPSGLNADTGSIENVAVKANMTATMGFRKIGLTIGKGISYTGIVEVVNISVPKEILPSQDLESVIINEEDVKRALPKRHKNAHKHSVGKVLVIAGSRGMTGAAAMTAMSAMRSGAGAVILGTPKSIHPILAKKLTEVMVEPLPETSDSTLSLASYEIIKQYIHWADILICGPGISTNEETSELVKKIVSSCDKPILLDADGLNNICDRTSILKKFKVRGIIITPHMGEFSRLTGLLPEQIEKNKIEIARRFALQWGVTLVLKGAPTITVSKDGNVFINSSGNPGMATAGMGDILSGLIGGLWSQGMETVSAAYSGVFIHGQAGDFAKIKLGEKSLMALDVQTLISKSILHIENDNPQ
jgi:ADP-dependent NAD(P)H-hydrate dehydratase / NAD(P)H-hydrate epimerase